MTGFDQGDIVVLGADLSSFDAVSDTVYKVSVAPRDLIVTLNVAAAAAKGLTGDDSLAAEEARSVARPGLRSVVFPWSGAATLRLSRRLRSVKA